MVVTPDFIEAADPLDRLANSADYADAAHDMANKKAKLAEQAHRARGEHDDSGSAVEEDGDIPSDPNRSAWAQAWDAARDKLGDGALMFAGFSLLLSGMIGLSGLLIANGFLATVTAAAATGATWLAGNEFIKVYRRASQRETNRLDTSVDSVRSRAAEPAGKETTGHQRIREAGELGVVAGSLSSHTGGTVLLRGQEQAATRRAPDTRDNPAIRAILDAGPRERARAILERGSNAERCATERAAETSLSAETRPAL